MKGQKSTWSKEKPKYFSYSNLPGLFFLIFIPGYFLYHLTLGILEKNLMHSFGILTRAVVIDDKNFLGNSPVSQSFSYSYSFEVAGRKYVGNTRDIGYQVGDTIQIKYAPNFPRFSRVITSE